MSDTSRAILRPECTKIPGLRWYMVGMLCLASELNYLDRQTLSVLAPTIQDDLKISTTEYANITSAFLGSYAVMYAVSGRLVDWLGTRRSFLIFVTSWSLVNRLNVFARTALHFSVFRFLLGAAEPASFPAGGGRPRNGFLYGSARWRWVSSMRGRHSAQPWRFRSSRGSP